MRTTPIRRVTTRGVVAILFAAALVPSFDYAIGRVGRDIQLGRQAQFEAIVEGSALSPYRYRVLVPYAVAPVVGALKRYWPPDVAFRRVDGVFDLAVLTTLLFVTWRYLRIWFTEEQALAGALFVGCTLPIALRQHFYAPYSFVEPILLTLALECIARRRLVAVFCLTFLATLNRETGFLIPVALIAAGWSAPSRHGRQLTLAVLCLVVSGLTSIGLRAWLGAAPSVINPQDVLATNLTGEGLAAAAVNVTLFAGGTGWLLAAGGWSRTPPFVRRTAWLVVVYLPLYLFAGVWYEVRLLMPLYPVLLPAMLAGLFQPRLAEAPEREARSRS